MSPERTYHIVVVPVSLLMLIGGVFLAACFWVMQIPITSRLPFIANE